MMKAFAKQNRVLFVNSIGIKMPDFRNDRFAWKRLRNKLGSLARYVKHPEPNIYVLTPVALPFIGTLSGLIGRINKALLLTQLNAIMALLKFRAPILWVTVPVVRDAVFHLRARKAKSLIYYCVDNVSQFPGVDRERILQLELEIHQKADVSFFVNHRLLEERKSYNARTFYLGHGVDYDHFAKAQDERLPVPTDVRDIPRPMVGYMGEIRGLDFKLVRYLAQENPDMSFVFLGESYDDIAECRLPNIYFLGKKSYAELPNYLQGFACCCLYYKTQDAFNQYRNPKKLMEYLSTGKPVVSVDILEMHTFRDMVSIAGGYEEDFNRMLRSAVYDDSPELKKRRIAFAKEQTWDAVAARAAAHLPYAVPFR
jgi:glycosyltransferase involved in cell wall biosynthesis